MHPGSSHYPRVDTRREFLFQAGGGLGGIALAWLMQRDAKATTSNANPLAPRPAHFPGRAKSVIFMFMVGGPSQLDIFDPKPELEKRRGQPLPDSVGRLTSQFTKGNEAILPSSRIFKKHGKSGQWMSDLMPNLATCVDDLCY